MRKIIFISIIIMISISNASAWLNEDYLYGKPIILTGNTSGAQTDYQLLLNVTYDSDMQSDFDDLRFCNDTHQIDAWLESKVDSSYALIWVEFPTTPANTVEQTYYMYYGNASMASDWDGAAAFAFFDDFEDGDVSDWTNDAGGCIEAQATQVKSGTYSGHGCGTTNAAKSYKQFSNQAIDFILEYDLHPNAGCIYSSHFYFIIADGVTAYPWDKSIWFDTYHHATFRSHAVIDILSFNEQWYHWKFVIKPSTSTYSLWIDDVSKQTDVVAKGDISGGLDTIAIAQYYHSAAGNYIDNIIIRKYAAYPPTYEFGAEEKQSYSPPTPINLQNTTGYYWVNYTWSPDSGNVTDSYNVSFNTSWHNTTTDLYFNQSITADSWGNISIWAYNNTNIGALSDSYIHDEIYIETEGPPPTPPPPGEGVGYKLKDNEIKSFFLPLLFLLLGTMVIGGIMKVIKGK